MAIYSGNHPTWTPDPAASDAVGLHPLAASSIRTICVDCSEGFAAGPPGDRDACADLVEREDHPAQGTGRGFEHRRAAPRHE